MSIWSQLACWLGLHRWDMPGGCCEDCGRCDEFFGGHEQCGVVCRFWKRGANAESRRE